ncbi:MAG TPA: ABC transporter substrate-binding protein [Steroidobacteraceae bacterium]|nr:ABC transporter substrate-binding protein [Steroidobacteraceae bacterium]
MSSVDRRTALLALTGAWLAGPRAFAGARRLRVAALDWALAETMLALRYNPVALVAAGDWNRFVVEPALPPGIADVGLQQQVNFELLAALQPDLILTSPFSQQIEPVLRRIAPTERFSVFAPSPVPLRTAQSLMRALGGRLGRTAEAAEFLRAANAQLDAYRERVRVLRPPPVLLINFVDARHARVYGGAGLFQNVLDRIGVSNAWTGATNYWGFTTVGIERLATNVDLRLMVFDPVPADVRPTLSQSPLWLELPFVRAGHVARLPPVLMFGAMPAALRFARLLMQTLERNGA